MGLIHFLKVKLGGGTAVTVRVSGSCTFSVQSLAPLPQSIRPFISRPPWISGEGESEPNTFPGPIRIWTRLVQTAAMVSCVQSQLLFFPMGALLSRPEHQLLSVLLQPPPKSTP